MNCKLRTNKGFTLAEAMMATVVLGIAAAGILLPFTSGASARVEGMRRTLAAELARDLMERVINTPCAEIMDSYNGYAEPQGQIKDDRGVVFTDSNYAKFSRGVNCEQRTVEGAKFILVTVRVYYSGSEIAVVNRLISEK